MKRRLAVLLGFILCGLGCFAQDSLYARRVIGDMSAPSMFGRCESHRGDSIAAAYIRNELKQIGVTALADDYYQYFPIEKSRTKPPITSIGYRTQNVCGIIPGESDSLVVYTAHYDHLGTHGDTLFPGAHDNASGVAAVLDLARTTIQSKPHYTHIFYFFSGEEAGLIGSRYAATHLLFDPQKVRILCNIDMFCGGDEGFMVVNANAENTRSFVERLQLINDQIHATVKIGRRDNASNSDHYYFTALCPAIFIYTLGGPHGNYHSPDDTCDNCGLGNYENILTLISLLSL